MKWCWSRLPGGVVTWETYELFKVGEIGTFSPPPQLLPDCLLTLIRFQHVAQRLHDFYPSYLRI